MNLNKIFSFLTPKDRVFHKLFAKASENLVEIAKVQCVFFHSTSLQERATLMKEIERLEHVGDNITHEVFTELSSNFITPFDREDISYLTASLDDIVDFIDASAKRYELYNVKESTPAMKQLSKLIEKAALQIHQAVPLLNNMDNLKRIKQSLVEIHSIENEADSTLNAGIAELFSGSYDAIEIIKQQEILNNLEVATDKCEDVANVIETILIKNS